MECLKLRKEVQRRFSVSLFLSSVPVFSSAQETCGERVIRSQSDLSLSVSRPIVFCYYPLGQLEGRAQSSEAGGVVVVVVVVVVVLSSL